MDKNKSKQQRRRKYIFHVRTKLMLQQKKQNLLIQIICFDLKNKLLILTSKDFAS